MPIDPYIHFSIASICASLVIAAVWINHRYGFFTLSPAEQQIGDKRAFRLFFMTFLAFATFITLAVVIIPSIVYLLFCQDSQICSITPLQLGWIKLFTITTMVVCIVGITLLPQCNLRHLIWGCFSLHSIFIGIAAWLIGYPTILAVGQLVAGLTELIYPHSPIQQIAVQELLQVKNHPVLFGCLILSISTLVPITEEVLFRGLLQNTLMYFFGRRIAIPFASAIFALFHYSPLQEASNLELLSSLFIAGCILGLLYEQQRSLYASIAFHSTFNTLSIILLLLFK